MGRLLDRMRGLWAAADGPSPPGGEAEPSSRKRPNPGRRGERETENPFPAAHPARPEGAARQGQDPATPRGGGPPAAAEDPTPSSILTRRSRARLEGSEHGFLLAVDDGGELLVLGHERVLFGHASNAAVDVGLLADVGPEALELVWRSSLRGGGQWVALGRTPGVTLAGEPLGAEGVALSPGAVLQLAHNLQLQVLAPDPASATILLEIHGSDERHGIRRVALLAEGSGGRLSIGPSRLRHVAVRGLELEVALVRSGAQVLVDAERKGGTPSASSLERFRIPFPPDERIDLQLGRPRGSRPPFALSILPLARSAGAPGGRSEERR